MLILGIETSCDETSAAVVKDGRWVLSNIIASSLEEHKKYGGIIPEIASRRQMELIHPVVDEALAKAGVPLRKISAIAVTKSPGLIGSLLVGVAYARGLAFALKKPLVDVDHIKAHIYANFLSASPGHSVPSQQRPTLPAVGLIVSGGHSSLYYLKDFTSFQLMGHTIDDAAGEAFDKVARLLKLGYPGGPVIDRLAREGANDTLRFAAAELPGTFDFSFSGVKTAVLYYQQKHGQSPDFNVARVAYSFQESVVGILVKKALAACRKKKAGVLLVGGGVAANSALREQLTRAGAEQRVRVFFPPMNLCIDNAAMIAGWGYHLLRK